MMLLLVILLMRESLIWNSIFVGENFFNSFHIKMRINAKRYLVEIYFSYKGGVLVAYNLMFYKIVSSVNKNKIIL